jgi:hypothetical protein
VPQIARCFGLVAVLSIVLVYFARLFFYTIVYFILTEVKYLFFWKWFFTLTFWLGMCCTMISTLMIIFFAEPVVADNT